MWTKMGVKCMFSLDSDHQILLVTADQSESRELASEALLECLGTGLQQWVLWGLCGLDCYLQMHQFPQILSVKLVIT